MKPYARRTSVNRRLDDGSTHDKFHDGIEVERAMSFYSEDGKRLVDGQGFEGEKVGIFLRAQSGGKGFEEREKQQDGVMMYYSELHESRSPIKT